MNNKGIFLKIFF